MRGITIILAVLALGLAGLARAEEGAKAEASPAASAPALKLGYVNLEEIMRGYYKAEASLAKIEKDVKDKEEEVEKLKAEIRKLKAEKDLLSTEARMKKEEEILEKSLALKRFTQEVEQDLELRLMTERKKLEQEIREKIEDKAKSLGYSFVFVGELILYKDPALNITKEILAELNKDKK